MKIITGSINNAIGFIIGKDVFDGMSEDGLTYTSNQRDITLIIFNKFISIIYYEK